MEGDRAVLTGSAPAACMGGYQKEVTAYTGGAGRLSFTFSGYGPCHNTEEVVAAIGYEADGDTAVSYTHLDVYKRQLLVFAATGRTRIAVPAVSILLFILSLAEAFVVSFRSRPIMFWDILAFGTAMTVSQNYVFTITKSMKIAGLILLCLLYTSRCV